MQFDLTAAENLSNFAWLVFALASVALWRPRVLPGLGFWTCRSLFALVCFVIFMFPVISISDDLHPDLIIAAEGDGKSRRLLQAANHTSSSHATRQLPLVEGLGSAVILPALEILSLSSPLDQLAWRCHATRTQRGRAPPLSPLA